MEISDDERQLLFDALRALGNRMENETKSALLQMKDLPSPITDALQNATKEEFKKIHALRVKLATKERA